MNDSYPKDLGGRKSISLKAKPVKADHSVYRMTGEWSEGSTEDEYRIDPPCGGTHLVVFGKTGSGKSSLCNQLVGNVHTDTNNLVFPVARSLKAVTHRHKHHYAQQHGHNFTVVDTPGRDSDTDSAQSRLALQKLIESLQRHIVQDNATSPGHVHSSVSTRNACKAILVFCVRCDARYAGAEHETYQELKKLWGNDEDFCQRLVVAFTMGDTLAADSDRTVTSVTEKTPKERKLKDMLNKTWPQLKQLIRDASRRYILFNNKEGHDDERAVGKLLAVVDKMDVSASPREQDKEKPSKSCLACWR